MLGKSRFGRSDVIDAVTSSARCQRSITFSPNAGLDHKKKKTFVPELARKCYPNHYPTRGGEWEKIGGGMTAVAEAATFHHVSSIDGSLCAQAGGPLCICHVLCFCWNRAVLPQLLELCVKRLAVCPHPKRFKAEQYLCYLCPRKGKGQLKIGG